MNSTERKHSPLPWSVEENVTAGGISHLAIVNRKNGDEWMMASITPMDKARAIDYANASHICRSVNSHEALFNALTALLKEVEQAIERRSMGHRVICTPTLMAARTALELAGKEQS